MALYEVTWCMVYTERAEMAAVSCGTSHASAVSTPLRWIFKNALKKAIHWCRITCERSESARERRIALYKSDQYNNVKDGPFFRCFVTPCHIAKFFLHVLSHRHVLSPRYKTYRKIHSVHGLSLFSSNIVIHLSSSLDVCIGVRECARALCFVVFYYPRFR